jgi:hypothetical protein
MQYFKPSPRRFLAPLGGSISWQRLWIDRLRGCSCWVDVAVSRLLISVHYWNELRIT